MNRTVLPQRLTLWAGGVLVAVSASFSSCTQLEANDKNDPGSPESEEAAAVATLPTKWVPVALQDQDETTSAFALTQTGSIIAGTSAGLLVSYDGGTTWSPVTDVEGEKAAVFSLTSDDDGTLYAGLSKYGILVSEDDGKSWKTFNEGLNVGGPRSSYAILATGQNVLKGTYESGAYMSEDKGRSWKPCNYGIPLNTSTSRMVSVTQLVKNNSTVYALTDLGVRYSTDSGKEWNKPRHDGIERLGYMLSLAVKGDTLYTGVGTSGKGVYYSVNNGESWVQAGLQEEEPYALHVTAQGILYAGTQDGEVYRTANSGRTWEKVTDGLPESKGVYALYATPDGKVLAGLNRKGIYLLQ